MIPIFDIFLSQEALQSSGRRRIPTRSGIRSWTISYREGIRAESILSTPAGLQAGHPSRGQGRVRAQAVDHDEKESRGERLARAGDGLRALPGDEALRPGDEDGEQRERCEQGRGEEPAAGGPVGGAGFLAQGPFGGDAVPPLSSRIM